MNRYRQGDVFLFPCKIPATAAVSDKRVLAYGEVTGHQHELFGDVTVYVGEDGELYCRANTGAHLDHVDQSGQKADHDPITLPQGDYKVTIQRQYEPDGWRFVAD